MWASILSILNESGLLAFFEGDGWKNAIMIGIACFLLYLAIGRQFEPLLLLPIAFGMLLVNLPLSGVMDVPTTELVPLAKASATEIAKYGQIIMPDGQTYVEVAHSGGLLYYLYLGVKLGIYPPLIFLGIGAMSDFGPLIANPKSFILGAAAQIGIFFTFCGAILLGFPAKVAGSIAIIGGADGPTAIYVTSKLAADYLGPIAVAAYSYMALVPIIQPPIMRLLTTKKERSVVMTQLRTVSKTEKIMFPIIVTIVVALLLPSAAPLVGMLMLGNLMRESGVVKRISDAAQNELMNIVTIFLGTTVGATARAEVFLTAETLMIVGLGLAAFCLGTAFGVIFGKLMYIFTGGKVNPLIGSAGVSAVPMAARVSQKVGQETNPSNYLLMHALGPNVAGVIGSAVAAGVLLAVLR
jgi:sodium ion-translocating decarboxylase, beta subunit